MPAKFEIVVMDGGSSGAAPGATSPSSSGPAAPAALSPDVVKKAPEEQGLERFAERVKASVQSSAEALGATLGKLDKAFDAGLLSEEERDKARASAQAEFMVRVSEVDRLSGRLKDFDDALNKGAISTTQYESARAAALEQFVARTGSAGDALSSLEQATNQAGATEAEIARVRAEAGREATESQRKTLESFAERVKVSVETPAEQLGRTLARLDEAFNAGLLSEEERNKARQKFVTEFQDRQGKPEGVDTSGIVRGLQEIANLFGMGGPFGMLRQAVGLGSQTKSWFEGLAVGGDGASAPVPAQARPALPTMTPPTAASAQPPVAAPAPTAPALPSITSPTPAAPVAPAPPASPPPVSPAAPVATAAAEVITAEVVPSAYPLAPPIINAAAGAAGVEGASAAAGTAATSSLAALATAAAPAAIALGAVALGGFAVKKFFDFVEKEADRLAKYSGELSISQARTQITRDLNEMRAAERLGPELAKFENVRADLESAFSKANTELKVALLKVLEPMLPAMQLAAKGVENVAGMVKMINDSWAGAIVRFAVLGPVGIAMLKYLKELADAQREKEAEDALNDPFLDIFLADLAAGAAAFSPGMFAKKRRHAFPDKFGGKPD